MTIKQKDITNYKQIIINVADLEKSLAQVTMHNNQGQEIL